MLSRKAWSLRSAALRCGAGSAEMPSARGNIEPGSSLAIPTSPIKPVRSSIFTNGFGKAPRWVLMTMLFPPTKRPAFKPDGANSPHSHQLPAVPLASSTSTFAKAPGPTWRLGMSIGQKSSVAVKSTAESPPVDRLVSQVMGQEPYQSARRVFWIMDNCSAHRGQKAAKRLREKWPQAILIHTPVHASWLNQVEIYFSIVQRKLLTPNDFSSLAQLEQSLLAFQGHYQQSASPFKWTFTRRDLHNLLVKIEDQRLAPAA
jgi:hypothetical protein